MTLKKRPSFRKSPPPLRRPERPSEYDPEPEPSSGILNLFGYHPVLAALEQGYSFKKLYIQKSLKDTKQELLIEKCKALNIPFYFESREFLDDLASGHLHQGLVGELKKGAQIKADLEAFLATLDTPVSSEKSAAAKQSIIIIADHINDPRNLGALSRSAVFFGCDMIIVEQSHTAPLSDVVHKTSAGASLLIPYYMSPQLSRTLLTLKAAGYIVIASTLSDHPEVLSIEQLLKKSGLEKVVLLIGNEAQGVRPHLKRIADNHVKITGATEKSFNSLNLSVAAGILLYALRSHPQIN